jgi:hypothetical protein
VVVEGSDRSAAAVCMAGPSTSLLTRCASSSAQDDSLFFAQDDSALGIGDLVARNCPIHEAAWMGQESVAVVNAKGD